MGGVFTVVIQSDDGYNNDNDEKRISGGIAWSDYWENHDICVRMRDIC